MNPQYVNLLIMVGLIIKLLYFVEIFVCSLSNLAMFAVLWICLTHTVVSCPSGQARLYVRGTSFQTDLGGGIGHGGYEVTLALGETRQTIVDGSANERNTITLLINTGCR